MNYYTVVGGIGANELNRNHLQFVQTYEFKNILIPFNVGTHATYMVYDRTLRDEFRGLRVDFLV